MADRNGVSKLALALGGLLALAVPAFAGDAATESDKRAEETRLAEEARQHPTDYGTTYRYVLLASELHDYEAAIGALERLLMFNPNLARARKELGFLYVRLGAYSTAVLNLRKALESPDLDAAQKAQIEAQLPEIERQTQSGRFSANLHVGLRA